MKVRYLGKLYNTDNLETTLENKREHGYWGDQESFIAKDGKKIIFSPSKFTNFEHEAFLDEWSDDERMFGYKENSSGIVIVELNIRLHDA